MTNPRPVAVILAAGASSRMGAAKGLLRLADGRTLVEAHRDALAPHACRVVVVTGAHTDTLGAVLGETVALVHNPDWATTGASDSLALALSGVQTALVTPVDAPPATLQDLTALLAARAPAVLSWQGSPGHPVTLDRALCARLRAGPVPGGLRTLLVDARSVAASTPDALLNLNTPADWHAWLRG